MSGRGSEAPPNRIVKGDPAALSELVNEAIQQGDKFITFTGSEGKKLSVIAELIESIWEE
jgi:hypothetical protein